MSEVLFKNSKKARNIVALILARGGSKRLPRKNLADLGGKPLIAWSIERAIESNIFSRVIVSTDDREIANVSLDWGAEIPWMRPARLASDYATSIDAVMHAIDELEAANSRPDAIMLLQPTLPFRSVSTIKAAANLWMSDPEHPVVTFTNAQFILEWCFERQNSSPNITPILGWDSVGTRSQEARSIMQVNGVAYVAGVPYLKKHKSFLSADTVPLLTDESSESLDIDTLEDLNSARSLLQSFS